MLPMRGIEHVAPLALAQFFHRVGHDVFERIDRRLGVSIEAATVILGGHHDLPASLTISIKKGKY